MDSNHLVLDKIDHFDKNHLQIIDDMLLIYMALIAIYWQVLPPTAGLTSL